MEFLSKIDCASRRLGCEALSLVPFSECKSRNFLHNCQIFWELFYKYFLKGMRGMGLMGLLTGDYEGIKNKGLKEEIKIIKDFKVAMKGESG